MFRYNKTIPVSYNHQGLIYFWAHNYSALPENDKSMIRHICSKAAGDYGDAVLAYVTRELSADEVCMKFYVERRQLFRLVRKFYIIADNYVT